VSRRVGLTVAGIVGLGAALRLWTIGAGLPYTPAVDEPEIVDRAVAMMRTGNFNPHPFYDYPTLTIYAHAGVATARFLAGAIAHEWTSLDNVWAGDFFLWSRIATALVGTLSIYVMYRAALRWSAAVALIASFAMAIQPLHVRQSQLALTDTPLTFFVLLATLASLVAAERQRTQWFALAGLTAGLAAATKYNGGLALVMPLAAVVALPSNGARLAAAGAVIASAAAGFVLGAPFTVLDLPGFLNGFAALVSQYADVGSWSDGAVIYLKWVRGWFAWPGALWLSVAAPALVLCLVGLGSIAVQLATAHRTRALIVLSFTGVYFGFIADQALRHNRYALPIAPAVCLLFAVGLVTTRDLVLGAAASGGRRRLATAALLVVLAPSVCQAIASHRPRTRIWTEHLAAEWVLANVRHDEPIAIEAAAMRLPPPYQARYMSRLTLRAIEEYLKDGTAYLVSSSAETDKYYADPTRHGGDLTRFTAILRATDVVRVFSPSDEHPGATVRILKVMGK
jgi:4-amino-4-deoxy-L-arabinose transferase-like glycosyltransferase